MAIGAKRENIMAKEAEITMDEVAIEEGASPETKIQGNLIKRRSQKFKRKLL